MFRPAVVLILALAAFTTAGAQEDSLAQLGPVLEQARLFSATQGDRLWPGYGEAPFGFLLVGEERDILICQQPSPAGFVPDGIDAATGCTRETRPRTGLPADLLAAMPMFGDDETIVMGTPKTTGRSRAEWVRTILHEHFHQYQATFPDYFQRTNGLGLQGGTSGGQWMLDYPFPYSDPRVSAAYAVASNALADAVASRGKSDFLPVFDRYLTARKAFETSVTSRDWRYLEFEFWQEGMARWTEITLGERYPDAAVREASLALLARTLAKLRNPDLKAQGRELVYPYGAGEAMLMEACGSAWRKGYPRVLSLGGLLAEARTTCASEVSRPSGQRSG